MRQMNGAKISCIARSILPPGTTMVLARDIHELSILLGRYGRITALLLVARQLLDPLQVSALEGCAFIVREHGSGTRTAMETFFAGHRFEPHIAMEMSSNETTKQAVMAGMGLGFLSLHAIGLALDNALAHVLDIEGTPVIRRWNGVRLQSKLLSPAAEAFRYFIIERGETHFPAHDAPLLERPGGGR